MPLPKILEKNSTQRVLSAAFLLPAVLGILIFAPLWGRMTFFASAALLMIYELLRMSKAQPRMWVLSMVSAASVFFALLLPPLLPFAYTAPFACGALAVYAFTSIAILFTAHTSVFVLMYACIVFGMINVALMATAPEVVLWMMLLICVNDTAAYVVGRTLKGPKLWAAVSPGKTWSGFIGGVLISTLVGTMAAPYLMCGGPLVLAQYIPIPVQALFLSLAANGGDLMESAAKRYYGVKDSSGLIPGHGGVLDRFDSVLGASLGTYILGLCYNMYVLLAQWMHG